MQNVTHVLQQHSNYLIIWVVFFFFVKKKTFQKYGLGFLQFPRALVMLFLIKIDCIFTSLKIPSFCQKKKKMFLCIRPSLSKPKKIILHFYTTKKTSKKIYIYFIMHFGFNNQFIKVMRTLAII